MGIKTFINYIAIQVCVEWGVWYAAECKTNNEKSSSKDDRRKGTAISHQKAGIHPGTYILPSPMGIPFHNACRDGDHHMGYSGSLQREPGQSLAVNSWRRYIHVYGQLLQQVEIVVVALRRYPQLVIHCGLMLTCGLYRIFGILDNGWVSFIEAEYGWNGSMIEIWSDATKFEEVTGWVRFFHWKKPRCRPRTLFIPPTIK